MLKGSRTIPWLPASLALVALTACSSPSITGFNISGGPATISLAPGSSTEITLNATAANTTPVTATVVIYNLPKGVTMSPASPTVVTGQQTSVVLTAAPSVAAGSSVLQVTGYAGLAYSTINLNLAVSNP